VIHISVTTAFLVYSIALAVIFLALYLYTEMGERKSHRVLTRQFLWRCVYCGYTYLDEGAEALSQCPRCRSLNDEAESRPREVQTRPGRRGQPAPEPTSPEARRNPSRRKNPHRARRGPRRRR
jgi:phage FluMu protein Com